MNYLIHFTSTSPAFLAPNNTITDKLTEALVFPNAQTAGLYLDNYMEVTGNLNYNAIIRPTGL